MNRKQGRVARSLIARLKAPGLVAEGEEYLLARPAPRGCPMNEPVLIVAALAEGAFKSSESATVTLSIDLSEWRTVADALAFGRPVRFEVAEIQQPKVLDVDMAQAFPPRHLASDPDVIARGGIVTPGGVR